MNNYEGDFYHKLRIFNHIISPLTKIFFLPRFYHQLTDSIENFVSDPTANSSINLVEFHTSFIAPISDKINQLRLCRIVNIIADTINSSFKYFKF